MVVGHVRGTYNIYYAAEDEHESVTLPDNTVIYHVPGINAKQKITQHML